MPGTITAFELLQAPDRHAGAAVAVVFGGEAFLARVSLEALRDVVLGADDGGFSLTRLQGPTADWRSVADELSTAPMFGGRRMVWVEEADDFVTRYRPRLEDYVAAPTPGGMLVLAVKTWPSNTRLYKAVDQSGLAIDCKPPTQGQIVKWLTPWAKRRHGAELAREAAEALLEIIGPELGLIDQKLATLAVLAGKKGTIDAELVREMVGGWRAKTAWEMIDAAAAGDAPSAIVQLDRLLLAGEQPVALLGQMASTLRRFAAATRLVEESERAGRRVSLKDALAQAGVKPFLLAKAESQLRQIGRRRAARLFRQLLEADLAIKGSSSAPGRARLVLEQLIVRLSTALAAAPG
jgi:DNA polymerase-3 subunit delta